MEDVVDYAGGRDGLPPANVLKFLLTGLLLLAGMGMNAQEFSVTDFSVARGGTADVDICLTCEAEARACSRCSS